jgi:hypothetical protein
MYKERKKNPRTVKVSYGARSQKVVIWVWKWARKGHIGIFWVMEIRYFG